MSEKMENGGHAWSDIELKKKLSFYPLVMMLNLMRGRKLCQSERESDKNYGQPMRSLEIMSNFLLLKRCSKMGKGGSSAGSLHVGQTC